MNFPVIAVCPCGEPLTALDIFPGNVCLTCHARKEDALPLVPPDFAATINLS
jgi:hypothetical protein